MEKRLLQAVIALVACVPVYAGGAGMLLGPAIVGAGAVSVTADSHFRYLSGLLLGVGFCYWSCLPQIERRGARLSLLTFLVFVGGVGRAMSLVSLGAPSRFHVAALAIELAVAPAVWLWQRRVAANLNPSAKAG
jgi:hypothetical protein